MVGLLVKRGKEILRPAKRPAVAERAGFDLAQLPGAVPAYVHDMNIPRFGRAATLVLAFFLQAMPQAHAVGLIGPQAMQTRHASLLPELSGNVFGGPIHLRSADVARRVDGDVYAVLSHPFTTVRSALADAGQWCDVLILHLNTKQCRRAERAGAPLIELHVGKKEEQPVRSATLLALAWRPVPQQADYFAVDMAAADGPYGTRDYHLLVEAVPLEGSRTFLHMDAFSYNAASQFALQLYLGTIGRDKVGFTPVEPDRGGRDQALVGGMRGVVERNTMRYYFAIDAYLRSLAAPRQKQVEQRLSAWFDSTEKHPRQLREVDRESYMRMKRNELERQAAAH
jgi:hypothetical protein